MTDGGFSNETSPRLWPALVFQASFVCGVAVFKAAATAMVVARLSAEAMPPIYIGAALLTALLAPLQGALVRSSLPPRTSLVASVILTLFLGVMVAQGSGAAVVALYLWAEVYATLASLRFWAAVGEMFDPRESKRVFAVISGYGMAGCIVGGVVAKTLGEELGSFGFLAIAAASMLVCRFAAFGMSRVGGARLAKTTGSAKDGFVLLARDPYARMVALLAVVLSALNVGADYAFRLRAEGARSEDQLAALFGEVSLWVGLFATAFQFLFAGKMLLRFGIFRYLLIVPVICLGMTVLSGVHPGLWPVFVLKVVETVGSLSVNPTALQLLYAPLPDATRPVARAVIDGFVKKSGIALGGLALMMFGLASEASALSLVGGSCALVVWVVLRLKKLYVRALDLRLTRQKWSSAIGDDKDALKVLLVAVESPDPARALAAMEMLNTRDKGALRSKLPQLLEHASERVRERAASLAQSLDAKECVPRLRVMAFEDARRPRNEAIRVLPALLDDAETFLRPLLRDADPGVRSAAIAALVKVELASGRRSGPAMRALNDTLEGMGDAPVSERRETARMLAHLAETGVLRSLYAGFLEDFLRDEDASVRAIAAAGARTTRLLNLVPLLVEMLGRPRERRAAREALQSYGEEIVPVLAAALNDRQLPLAVRMEVPGMLRLIGGARAAEVLLFSNIQDDPGVRYRIVLALDRMRRQTPTLAMDVERVQQALGRRVDAYLYYRGIRASFAGLMEDDALLLRTLHDREQQNLEIIFRLLGLLVAQDSMLRAYQHLRAGPRERAYALELIENVLPQELRERIAPVLAPPPSFPPVPPEGEAQALFERLGELSESRDAVLAGIAVYTARRMLPGEMAFEMPEEENVSEDVVEKVFLIEGVDIFAKSDVDDLMALAALARERRFAAGEVIYRTNDPGDAVYIIIDGAVRIEKDGREIVVLNATESFGETSLLDGAPRPATAIAQRITQVLWIDRQDFLDLVSDRPELLKSVFGAVTRNLRRVLDAVAAGKLAPSRTPEVV